MILASKACLCKQLKNPLTYCFIFLNHAGGEGGGKTPLGFLQKQPETRKEKANPPKPLRKLKKTEKRDASRYPYGARIQRSNITSSA